MANLDSTNKFLKCISYARTWLGKPPNLFSQSIQAAFKRAGAEAKALGQTRLRPIHMLLAISSNGKGIGAKILDHFGIDHREILSVASLESPSDSPGVSEMPMETSGEFKIMLALAANCARSHHDWFIGTHHVLWAMLEQEGTARDFLLKRGVTGETVNEALLRISSGKRLED